MSDEHREDETGLEPDDIEAMEEAAEAASSAGADLDASNDPLATLQAENEELRDRALRALAELENTRKRAERDVQAARTYAIERFATDLISVADNLTRALESVPEGSDEGRSDLARNLLSGVEMTQRELLRAFDRHGVKQESPKGEPFDPNRHQAVTQMPSDVPSGRVAEVMQVGYVLGERPLRAAMVAVSTGPQGEGQGGGQAADRQPGGENAGGNTDFKV